MKKFTLLYLGILLFIFLGCTPKQITVLTNSKDVGRNVISGESIRAEVFIFPERIHDFKIDTSGNYATVHLRGLSANGRFLKNRSNFVRFDVQRDSVLWSRRVNNQLESVAELDGIILHNREGRSNNLDNATGRRIWQAHSSILHVFPEDDLGIGYRVRTKLGKANLVEGIDLKTGEPKWQRQIPREFGWNEIVFLNDSTLIVASSGLHSVNIHDGTGWEYSTKTGKRDYTAAIIGTGLGIAVGLLTGSYTVMTSPDVVTNIVSNILIHESNIYFASSEHLVKLSNEGDVIWQKPLQSDLTSSSLLFISDDDLVMINKGYATMGYQRIPIGSPYLANFDISSGEQRYLTHLAPERRDIIRGIQRGYDEITFVLSDYVSQYSLYDGGSLKSKYFETEKNGSLAFFIDEMIYDQHGSFFYSLAQISPNKYHLLTENGRVLVLDSNFEIEYETELDDFFIHYLTEDDKKFIAKNDQTYLIDAYGEKIAEFTASKTAIFTNGKLYDIQRQSFLEVNLESIFEKTP
ncbi:MAG: PQQ-like beta-propeller repeat protein [Oceanicaulis sp.]|nr:PQQ-like beta-propeller repeat protein [Oceanicaulis sp.]